MKNTVFKDRKRAKTKIKKYMCDEFNNRCNIKSGTKGITLIALVITIIILLILATVSITVLTGEYGIITQAQEASFRTEMSGLKEQVDIKQLECKLENKNITNIFTEQVKMEDVEKWDIWLKFEIIYWGQYDIGVNKLTRDYVKTQWETILKNGDNEKVYLDNLYYIDTETAGGNKNKYIYDCNVDIVYKIPLTKISKYRVHSLKELDYQKQNGNRDRDVITQGTIITTESEIQKVGNVACYEPDLSGFVQEKTKAVYYKTSSEGTVDEVPIELPVSQYLGAGEEKLIITNYNNEEYEFYNYEKTMWANIKVENSGVETYWVWIPRYAYNLKDTATNIIFVDTNDKNAITGEDLPSDYIVHPVFKDGKKGIWVSKYEAGQIASNEVPEYPYYIPDMSGFDKNNTYIEVYNGVDGFTETKLADISNLTEFSKNNKWFDYEKQIWANIKVVADGIESWWVWIPRYAYNISGTTTSIIFLDTENNPLSGEKLPSNYVVHPAFNNDLKGIWASKYETTQVVEERETTNNVNIPDMSGFNPDTTYIEVYNDDGRFTEIKLADIGINNVSQFAKDNRWYDYSKQIWANIKTVSEGVESWWVWIPRYAYNITGIETTVIFLDENGNPLDGSTLPSNYIPHPAFNNNLKGIWASKYEPKNK